MFYSKKKRKLGIPLQSQFCYIKVGYKGVFISRACFPDIFCQSVYLYPCSATSVRFTSHVVSLKGKVLIFGSSFKNSVTELYEHPSYVKTGTMFSDTGIPRKYLFDSLSS